jgi:FkbM family methyltransferase
LEHDDGARKITPSMKTSTMGWNFLRPFIRLGGWTYKIRQGVAAGLIRKGGLGFIPKPLSPEEKFLLDLDWEGQTVYDVGGYEGVFTLFFSKSVGSAGRVFTFEPNPANCQRINENIRLNRLTNVQLLQIGLGAGKGKNQLVFWPDEPARGTINASYQKSLRQKKETACIEIEIDSLDSQIVSNPLPPPDFVKIDVEAAELEVLEGMSRTLNTCRPRLFIEIHSGVDVKRLTHGLLEKGYRLLHVESKTFIDSANTHIAYNGHLYCTHPDRLGGEPL